MIVLDPPKLIPDRDEISAGKRKYFDLNVLAMKLVEPGGLAGHLLLLGLLGPQDSWPCSAPPRGRPSARRSSWP